LTARCSNNNEKGGIGILYYGLPAEKKLPMRMYEMYLPGGKKAKSTATAHSMPSCLGPWKESDQIITRAENPLEN
jgi:hypothetical protein